MEKLVAILAAFFLVAGAGVTGAQDQQYPDQQQQQYPANPGPYDQQQPVPQGPPPDQTQQSYPQAPPYPQAPSQQARSQQPNQAQPGAARVSFIHGDVSSQRGDNGQWVALTLNTPVMPGDRVATGHDSRAEIQLDYAGVLRLSNDATANIKTLERSNVLVQVGQGVATYSILRGGQTTAEIDTPNAAIHPLGEGDYRVVVNSDSQTQVIVRSGSADVSTPQGSTHVNRGQMITIAGTDTPQYKVDAAPGADEWDSWNSDRDRLISNASSWQHTDRYYVGSQDLDSYGVWSEIPDYGPVWTPRVAPGWAPYRAGQWVWEPYYGWTWVSYEPWGWAPYHYGRWVVYGGNWSWWPGPLAAYPGYYPIWAPAYVSFFGFGGGGFGIGFGFGFGFGRVGWLPIGPGDWFHPWYGGWGARYGVVGFNNYNGFHEGFGPLGRGAAGFSNINGAFRNEQIRGGISSMAGNEFGRGAVAAHQEGISEATLRGASAMSGRMPISPSRESFSASNRAPSAGTIRSASSSSQRFFSSSRAGSFGTAGRSFGSQGGFQRFTPSSSVSRGESGSASRPTLNMHQNIVTPRGGNPYGGYGSSSYGRSPYGGNGSSSYGRSPSYNSSPRGSYSAPQSSNESRGGGYSAPRGNYSAPRGGSRGGGGSHGGGHSSGHR